MNACDEPNVTTFYRTARLSLHFALLLFTACAIRPQAADIVLTGGAVWPGIEGQPLQQAIAFRNGRIIAVGSDASLAKFIGPET
jgi:hypothetical protein